MHAHLPRHFTPHSISAFSLSLSLSNLFLCSLSLSLTVCSLSHCPEPPPATPASSLLSFSLSACFLSRPTRAQPARDNPSHRSQSRTDCTAKAHPPICFSHSKSDLIWFFYFFLFGNCWLFLWIDWFWIFVGKIMPAVILTVHVFLNCFEFLRDRDLSCNWNLSWDATS